MRKINVTYTLTSTQEKRLEVIAQKLKPRTLEEIFQYIMELGSFEEINKKLTSMENFHGIMEE